MGLLAQISHQIENFSLCLIETMSVSSDGMEPCTAESAPDLLFQEPTSVVQTELL